MTKAFEEINESVQKLNKIWVDKVNEFYNRSTKSCSAVEIYYIYNEGKSVVAERFIRTFKYL